MEMRKLGRRMVVLACALGSVALIVTGMSAGTANATPAGPALAAPAMGIRFFPDGDAGQCGSFQGTFGMPIAQFETFGQQLRDDTDNRSGFCNLTFTLNGRTDVGLDIQFFADGDAGQCHGALPQGQFYTAAAGSPVTLGLDTDNRAGGCWLVLRLRHFGFAAPRQLS